MTNKQIIAEANCIIKNDREKLIQTILKNNQTTQTAIRAIVKEFSVNNKVANLILHINLKEACYDTKINFWDYLYSYRKGIKAYNHIVKSRKLKEIKINFVQDNLNILMENPMAIIQVIDTLYSESDYKYKDKILNKVYLAAFKLC